MVNVSATPSHCLFRFTEEELHTRSHKQNMTSSCHSKGLQSIITRSALKGDDAILHIEVFSMWNQPCQRVRGVNVTHEVALCWCLKTQSLRENVFERRRVQIFAGFVVSAETEISMTSWRPFFWFYTAPSWATKTFIKLYSVCGTVRHETIITNSMRKIRGVPL